MNDEELISETEEELIRSAEAPLCSKRCVGLRSRKLQIASGQQNLRR